MTSDHTDAGVVAGSSTDTALDEADAEIDALLTELESLDDVAAAVEPSAPGEGVLGRSPSGEAR